MTSNKGQQSGWKRAVSDVHGLCLRQRHLSGPSLVIWRTGPLASPLVTRQRSVARPLCRIQASNKGQQSDRNRDVTATQVALRLNPAPGLKKETTQVVLFIFNEACPPFLPNQSPLKIQPAVARDVETKLSCCTLAASHILQPS